MGKFLGKIEKCATDLKCLAMLFHYLNSSEFSIQPGEALGVSFIDIWNIGSGTP